MVLIQYLIRKAMKKLQVIFTLSAVLFAYLGCNQKKHVKELRPIKIGAVLPLTGDVASYGDKVKNGILLAKELSGSKIQVIIEDSKSKQADAVSAINKLIYDSVKVIIGEVSSGNTKAIAPVAQKNKVLLLSPSASDPAISTMGDYIFRIYPSDNYEGRELIKFIARKSYMGMYSITMLSDYGVGLKRVFTETAPSEGLDILGQYEYKQGETNYKTLLTKIKNRDAAVVIVGYGTELGTIVKQAREMGINNQFFSTVNFYDQNSLTAGKSAVEGVMFSALYLKVSSRDKTISNYVTKYKAKFNEDPDIWSALGFDCFNIINKSMVDSLGHINVDAVKNNLYNLKNYLGISGNTTFDKNGDVIKHVNFMTVKQGKFIPID
jgi:branched-chain amino acid transport system substrate-binding protein